MTGIYRETVGLSEGYALVSPGGGKGDDDGLDFLPF
jgi:hypothetical protein